MCRKPAGRPSSSTTNRAVIGEPVHQPERLGGEMRAAVIVFGLAVHDLGDRAAQQPVVHVAPQIAVGDDPDEPAARRRARRRSRSSWRSSPGSPRTSAPSATTSGTASPACMMSPTRSSRRPSLPPGWKRWKSADEKPLRSSERDRQRVAERHHHRRRGGRRQSHRAGLGRARQQQHDIGRLGQGRARARR